jgi:hypothetical protein
MVQNCTFGREALRLFNGGKCGQAKNLGTLAATKRSNAR